ncbi:MAG: XdhC family protein [Mogibacterium sp.]|nr:XdhC family protein [Mogibacterium sp.]
MRAMHDMPVMDLYDAISDANNNAETLIATVISGEMTGEKALIVDGKMTWNSAAEGFLRTHEPEVTAVKDSGIVTVDGQNVFVELLGNEKHVVICGAGHLSMPIITITKMLGMYVTVVDDREEFCENARKRGADRVLCKSFAEAFKEIEGSDDTFFVIVTRGHRYDKDCVGGALRKRHAYVGMIGSRRHARFVKESLLKEGLSEELIDSIYTPVGLNIGAETPEEIAVAIVGEIIEVKNRRRRNFGFTREVMKAIMDDDREPMMMATIILRRGSSPRGVGSRMLVRKDGSIIGTIGGGSAEGEIMAYAAELLQAGYTGTQVRHVGMKACADEDGMVCGGEIDVLLETV